jgi:citrate/tricarballylate utilization protein
MPATEVLAEARREMEICNACRYCEGYCAVFPAMELRRAFTDGELRYLANLCHDCKGCYYACQYAPPHEFGINLPRAFSELRQETYERHAWPRGLALLFERNGVVVCLLTAVLMAAIPLLTAWWRSTDILIARHVGPNAFYEVIPWGAMTTLAGGVIILSLVSLTVSALAFWRESGAGGGGRRGFAAFARALRDIASLRNLGGGGHGCNDRDGAFSQWRRFAHHALFYGFALCLASTCVAAFYHYAYDWPAPYPILSLPVLLGTFGGLGMMVGAVWLLALKLACDPAPQARRLLGGEYALIIVLLLAAATGLVLLALRGSAAMGIVLALHLGVILSFFLLIPYSKMVHGLYRSLALLRAAMERQEDHR